MTNVGPFFRLRGDWATFVILHSYTTTTPHTSSIVQVLGAWTAIISMADVIVQCLPLCSTVFFLGASGEGPIFGSFVLLERLGQ